MQAYIRRDSRFGQRWGLIVINNPEPFASPLFFCIQRQTDGKYLYPGGLWHSQRKMLRAERYHFNNGCLSISIEPELLSGFHSATSCRMTMAGGKSFQLSVSRDLSQELMRPYEPKHTSRANSLAAVGNSTKALILAIGTGLILCAAVYFYRDNRFMITRLGEPIVHFDSLDVNPGSVTFSTAGIVHFDIDNPDILNNQKLELSGIDVLGGNTQTTTEGDGSNTEARLFSRGALYTRNPGKNISLTFKDISVPSITDEDMENTLRTLEISAERGNTEAMYMLAQMLDPVSDLSREEFVNPLLALEWYRRAAACGLTDAAVALKNLKQYLSKQDQHGIENSLFPALNF